jgi:hypothetical protein
MTGLRRVTSGARPPILGRRALPAALPAPCPAKQPDRGVVATSAPAIPEGPLDVR